MNKKKYIMPTAEVVFVKTYQNLLTTSLSVNSSDELLESEILAPEFEFTYDE